MFLSACYGYRLLSPQKFLSFALLEHDPEVSSVLGIPDKQFVCYAKQTVSSTMWDCQ